MKDIFYIEMLAERSRDTCNSNKGYKQIIYLDDMEMDFSKCIPFVYPTYSLINIVVEYFT